MPRGVPTPDQLSHQQAEIEAARVDQDSFQNVLCDRGGHASHTAGFIEVRKRALQASRRGAAADVGRDGHGAAAIAR